MTLSRLTAVEQNLLADEEIIALEGRRADAASQTEHDAGTAYRKDAAGVSRAGPFEI